LHCIEKSVKIKRMKRLTENRIYQSICTVMAAVSLVSLVNVILIMFRVERNIAFSLFIPSWGANYSTYFAPENEKDLVLGIVCFGMIAMYYLCYVKAKENYQWLILNLILQLSDTAALVYFVRLMDYDVTRWLIDIVSHGIVILLMIWALYIGIKTAKENRLAEESANLSDKKDDPNKVMDYIIED